MNQYYIKAIRDDRLRLTLWRTLMAFVLLSPTGEESLNNFLSPDQDLDADHLRGGPSHGHNTSCVNKIKVNGAIVFELLVRTDTLADRFKCMILTHLSGSNSNDLCLRNHKMRQHTPTPEIDTLRKNL